jgi:cell division protein FtsZ
MSIDLSVPIHENELLTPRITVIGVGGAGGNAVNNMIESNLQGVDFMVANTDAQALAFSKSDKRIQLGLSTTQGLGAGARPEVGRAAAEESIEDIMVELEGSHMVFITAGMGGGTGTGAAPVIARAARDSGMLTVGVVTKPFHFEGRHRMSLADNGINELSQYVDTLIVIPNQNLFRIADAKTTFADAFRLADNVLHSGVRSVTDLIMMPGLINLDFADVRAVMENMGKAMMGTGEAEGDNRAVDAAERAISNPLLDDTSMTGAKAVLINIAGGADLGLFEVDEAAERIRSEVDADANIIVGSCFSSELEGKMRVSVVATGIVGDGSSTVVSSNSNAVTVRKIEQEENAAHVTKEGVANNNTSAHKEIKNSYIPKTAAADSKEEVPDASLKSNVKTLGQKVGNFPSSSGLSLPAASSTFAKPRSEGKEISSVNRVKTETVAATAKKADTFIPGASVGVDFTGVDNGTTVEKPVSYRSESVKVNARERSESVMVSDMSGKGRSLFELVTGRPRSERPEERTSSATSSVAKAPNLSVSESDRISSSSQSDEIMDIPAFLRK